MPVKSVLGWVDDLRSATPYAVERVPLADLPMWRFEPATGDLVHDSGRFFAVRGLAVSSPASPALTWDQPIVDQPETGILGFLCRRTGGGRYEFLFQSKMEPGNTNLVQLSPTLQATSSNYSRVHGGLAPDYLEHFDGTTDAQAVADTIQSETGARAWRKRNRNVIIEIDSDLPVLDRFRWVQQRDVGELLLVDDLVNMDARSVMATFPNHTTRPTGFIKREIARRRDTLSVERKIIPLNEVSGWVADRDGIRHESRNYFEVVGARVAAAEREVPSWGQPLLFHHGLGLSALFSRSDSGVRRYLFQAKFEAGNRYGVQLAATVSVFDYQARYEAGVDVPFLREYMELPASATLVSSIQSEEGGRFWNLRNRYAIVDVRDVDPGGSFLWLTRDEAKSCLAGDYLVSSEARTLLVYADLIEGAFDA